MSIRADEHAIIRLREGLATAGEDYKHNLSRLTNLIGEIAGGSIKGKLATDFKDKYDAKAEMFQKIQESIDEAESYMGMKKDDFQATIENTESEMK